MLCWTILLGERSGVTHESVIVFPNAWFRDIRHKTMLCMRKKQTMHCTAKANIHGVEGGEGEAHHR